MAKSATKTSFPVFCRSFGDNGFGTATIEFALCSAAFFGLLIAAAQVPLIYFAQQGVQNSAEKMARLIMTGEVRQSAMTAEQFRQAACVTLPSYMQCSQLMVDARQAATFDGLDTNVPIVAYDSAGSPTNLRYSTGTAGSIVILRLMYKWPVSMGPLGFNPSNQPAGGPRLLFGTMVFQSEAYT